MARAGLVRTVKRVRGRGGKTVARTYWTTASTAKAARVGGAVTGATVGGYAGAKIGHRVGVGVGARMIVAGSKRNSKTMMLAGLGVAAAGKSVGALGGALVGGAAGHALGRRVAMRTTQARANASGTQSAAHKAIAVSSGVSGAYIGHRVGALLGDLGAVPASALMSYSGSRMGMTTSRQDVRKLFNIMHHGAGVAGAIAGARIGHAIGKRNVRHGAVLTAVGAGAATHHAYQAYKAYQPARVFGANPTPSYRATHGAHARSFAGSFPSSKGMKGAGYYGFNLYRSIVGKTNRAFGRADRMLGG